MNEKRKNFDRISQNRVNKIIDSISKLSNLTNTSFYEYDDKQIIDLFDSIQNELDKQKKVFLDQRNKKKKVLL